MSAAVKQRCYRVSWTIDVLAGSHREAAEKARDIQRNPDSIAPVFVVRDRRDTRLGEAIDLAERP